MQRPRTRLRLTAVSLLAAGGLLLAGCGGSSAQSGRVTDKDQDRSCHSSGKKRHKSRSCSTDYELTTRSKKGKEKEFEVSKSAYENCAVGEKYPKCKD
jgi:hypothetical protein